MTSSADLASTPGVRRPTQVVTEFLEALTVPDVDAAMALLSPDVVYVNVSLPAVRGRSRVRTLMQSFTGNSSGFDMRIHRVAENGTSVLTERTDALSVGRFRMQFWVCGVFEVEDGVITLWRDYFDFARCTAAALRGLAGIAVPALRARMPD